MARRRARAGRLDGRLDGYDEETHRLSGPGRLLGQSGGQRFAGSFAECSVRAVGGNPSAYYAKKATWQETMAASIEALVRQEAEPVGKARKGRLRKGQSHFRRTKIGTVPRAKIGTVPRTTLAVAPARLLRSAVAAADGLGAAGRHLAADWPFGTVRRAGRALCRRHAGRPLAGQARELAGNAKTAADLDAVRRLYYRSREIEETLGPLEGREPPVACGWPWRT